MGSIRRGDWCEAVRARLHATANAEGWPEVSFPLSVLPSTHRASGRQVQIVMSGLFVGRDLPTVPVVTIGPGRESWEHFLERALYYDAIAAISALARRPRTDRFSESAASQ